MSTVDPVQAGVQRMLVEQLAQQMWSTTSVAGSDDDGDESDGSGASGIQQFSSIFADTLADAMAPAVTGSSTTKKAST